MKALDLQFVLLFWLKAFQCVAAVSVHPKRQFSQHRGEQGSAVVLQKAFCG